MNSWIRATSLPVLIAVTGVLAQPIPLWPDSVPGALGTDTVRDVPRLYPYPAPGASSGAAIVVVPGGAYAWVALAEEGFPAAAWFSQHGIACFVLRYRLGAEGYGHAAIAADIRRAVRWVRFHAPSLGIDTTRIGVLGFSAGGHLASVASTQFDAQGSDARDSVDRVSSRPAFSLLIYPVITMDAALTHAESRQNFLGAAPPQALVDSFSSEKRVTASTPPAFLVHSLDDPGVPWQNSALYRDSCLAHGVDAKYWQVYGCGHGFGTGCVAWMDSAVAWLAGRGIVPSAASRRPHATDRSPTLRTPDYRTCTSGVTFTDCRGRILPRQALLRRSSSLVVLGETHPIVVTAVPLLSDL